MNLSTFRLSGPRSPRRNRARAIRPPTSDSLLLLATHEPRFNTPVQLSRVLLGSARRHLQIRANCLLLLRQAPRHPHLTTALHASAAANIAHAQPLPTYESARVLKRLVVEFPSVVSVGGASAHIRLRFPSVDAVSAFLSFLPRAEKAAAEKANAAAGSTALLHHHHHRRRETNAAPSTTTTTTTTTAAWCAAENMHELPVLGTGATSTVHALPNGNAAKLLRKADCMACEPSLRQLAAERRAFSMLRHVPFTLQLRDAVQTATHFCLVTEAAHFGDLQAVLSATRTGCFPPAVARALFVEILLALDGVHAAGLLFRDLKLANVLLTAGGHVRLGDFGLVKKVKLRSVSDAASAVSSATGSGSGSDASCASSEVAYDADAASRLVGTTRSFVGTRRYMSPEVCGRLGGRREYGAAADVWALGVSLFVMLTGTYPFSSGGRATTRDGTTPAKDTLDHTSLMLSICNDDVHVPSFVDDDAKDLLLQLLNRDALERIDVDGIKKHAWLQGVDWVRVHDEAGHAGSNDVVLDFLMDEGVKGVLERKGADGSSTAPSVAVSQVSEGSFGPSSFKSIGTDCDLLGFDYMG